MDTGGARPDPLEQALPFKAWIVGVGLDSSEVGHPPAYSGGYLLDNFRAVQATLALSLDEVRRLCRNGVEASFLDPAAKQKLLAEIDAVPRPS